MKSRPKVALIGGGSAMWGPLICRDLCASPELRGTEVRLHDIDPAAARRVLATTPILQRRSGNRLRFRAEDSLDGALDGVDYVVVSIQVGGLEQFQHEIDIPAKYGSFTPVGGTSGPGLTVRTMVNAPVFLDIAHRMEKLCPDAWMLNLTNPVTTLTRIVTKHTGIRAVGICHGIWACRGLVAKALGVPREEVKLSFGGVNHGSYLFDVCVNGVSVYDRVRKALVEQYASGVDEHAQESDPLGHVSGNYVRFEILRMLGFLSGNADRHHSEFYPYFLRDGGRRYRVCPTRIERRIVGAGDLARRHVRDIASGRLELDVAVGAEPVNDIILARHFGKPYFGPVNLPNEGQIPNLPRGAVVESSGVIDAGGIRAVTAGPMPLELLPQTVTQVAIHELAVQAAETGDRGKVIAAVAADPLTRDWQTIEPMVDEMLYASRRWIPHEVKMLKRPGRRFLNATDPSLAAAASLSERCLLDLTPAFFRQAASGSRWDNPSMLTPDRVRNGRGRAREAARTLDRYGKAALRAALRAASAYAPGEDDLKWFLQSTRRQRNLLEFVIAADQEEVTLDAKGVPQRAGRYVNLYFLPAFAVTLRQGRPGGLLRRGVYVRRYAAFAALDEARFASAKQLGVLLEPGMPEAVRMAGQKAYRSLDVLTYDVRGWEARLAGVAHSRNLLEALRAAGTDLDVVEALLRAGETRPVRHRHALERLASQVFFSLAP